MRQYQKLNSLPKSIKTINDVWEFFNYLHNVDGVLFHPDQDFACYTNGETQKPTYTNQEVKERNKLMGQCFEVCAENEFDIFKVGIEAHKRNILNDKSPESGRNQTNIAVCILSEVYVDTETGEVVGFSPNKSYPILYDHPLWVKVGHPDFEWTTFTRWEFEKHFKYADEGEKCL